jgi:catalase
VERQNYRPTSQGLWDNQPEYADLPLLIEGYADHYDQHLDDHYWGQPGNLVRKTTPEQQQLPFDNTARAIKGASQEVLERHVRNWEEPMLLMAKVSLEH